MHTSYMYYRFPFNDLGLSRQIDHSIPDLARLIAHVAGWDPPSNPHGPYSACFMG